jgi:beta-glucosidase
MFVARRWPFKRLIGWAKILLARDKVKTVTTSADPRYLSIFNVQKNAWELVSGEYKIYVGGSSANMPLTATVQVAGDLTRR